MASAIVVTVLAAGSPASAVGSEQYRPPVDAPVVDPFRPPDQPWLPGNRGLEYDTVPGTVVGAIGPGLVVFAGPVAGQLHVTVLHPDGIRSSYSYLGAVSVVEGDRVYGGQPVGITGGVLFHLGARVGSTYIDPAALFGSSVGRASVFLVPLDGGTGPSGDTVEPDGPTGPSRASPPTRAAPSPDGAVTTIGAAIGPMADDLVAAVVAAAAPSG